MALQYYTNKFLRCLKKTKGDRDDDYKMLIQSRNTPLILHYYCYSGYLRISIIDGKSEKECKVSGRLKSLTHAYFVGCCNGLALFTSYTPSRLHTVVNPSSNEVVATVYGPFRGGDLCGFFFHPTAKEYRILSARKIEEEEDKYEYQLYQFGSKKWRKINANPYFKHKPTRNPAIVNDALHWDMGVILVFDMISEALSFKHALSHSL